MAEYTDQNIPINCAECDHLEEGIPAMEQHVLAAHPNYAPAEVPGFVRSWADSAYDSIDADNAWRAEEYRRTGSDPYSDPGRNDDEF